MKLAHIFEATERGQQGTGAQPEQPQEEKLPGISYDEMIDKMEGEDNGDDVIFVEDIEIKDPKNKAEYDSYIVFDMNDIQHQEPHRGSAWSVDSDVDYYGYTDLGGDIVYWAHSLDEDGERWEIVKGSVELTKRGDEQLDNACQQRFEDMKDNAEMSAAADRYDDMQAGY